MFLRESPVRAAVADLFRQIQNSYPDAREPLRTIVAEIIQNEKKYWQELQSDELAEIEALHNSLMGSTLAARLQQVVGEAPWDRDEQPDLHPLAQELHDSPETIVEHWPWLTSGDAADAWRLGEALAALDAQGELLNALVELSKDGHDLRLPCAYICTRRQVLGDEWYGNWVKHQRDLGRLPFALMIELAWRCFAAETIVREIVTALRSQAVGAGIVGRLSYGRWTEHLSFDVLALLIDALAESRHQETAVSLLERRLRTKPEEAGNWTPVALSLVTSSALIRGDERNSYAWKEVADRLVNDHARVIAAAIFREQADRESGTWFAEHSEAAGILVECARLDPDGVWNELKQHLTSAAEGYMFAIGFPTEVLKQIPASAIMAWIAEQPNDRAAMVAKLIEIDLTNDQTLAAQLLGHYGDHEDVASAFFSAIITGSWWGSASSRWNELASNLEAAAKLTKLPRVRGWALSSCESLREMAERDRQREEEEELRRR
jgi:hypothetical protein